MNKNIIRIVLAAILSVVAVVALTALFLTPPASAGEVTTEEMIKKENLDRLSFCLKLGNKKTPEDTVFCNHVFQRFTNPEVLEPQKMNASEFDAYRALCENTHIQDVVLRDIIALNSREPVEGKRLIFVRAREATLEVLMVCDEFYRDFTSGKIIVTDE